MAWSSPRYARQNGGDGIAQFIGIALATLGVSSSRTGDGATSRTNASVEVAQPVVMMDGCLHLEGSYYGVSKIETGATASQREDALIST